MCPITPPDVREELVKQKLFVEHKNIGWLTIVGAVRKIPVNHTPEVSLLESSLTTGSTILSLFLLKMVTDKARKITGPLPYN
ncbi:hypothetical protein T265_01468 [Opisthorchis viverrini]|uniref:Uncharacterized protein n=1 Tax=Opisthorchis viverrini TaxID=6198 RepID=A0A075AIX8_OPIVI|nr:hypothetical protein T265_01468 [Opisthorchis viverrini]KER32409.1 hypothetical protein T265_01468 [Opisthorchis viverrini]